VDSSQPDHGCHHSRCRQNVLEISKACCVQQPDLSHSPSANLPHALPGTNRRTMSSPTRASPNWSASSVVRKLTCKGCRRIEVFEYPCEATPPSVRMTHQHHMGSWKGGLPAHRSLSRATRPGHSDRCTPLWLLAPWRGRFGPPRPYSRAANPTSSCDSPWAVLRS
jgi:hypothetical protein